MFLRAYGFFFLILSLLTLGPLDAVFARPKIGLALSGGGARGIAHVGVLKELERLRIPIDFVVGTSVGSFVGAMRAAGYSVEDMEKILHQTDWARLLFDDSSSRRRLPFRDKDEYQRFLFDLEFGLKASGVVLPTGVTQGHRLHLFLARLFLNVGATEDFSQLPIPFAAVATELGTGRLVKLRSGDLPTALRASMAYPGLFAPVAWEGRLLTDGASSNNLPADLAREMGADFVIAVDVSSPLLEDAEVKSLLQVTDQFVTIMMKRSTDQTLKSAHALITPDLGMHPVFEFSNFERLIEAGEKATQKVSEQLRSLSLSKREYEEWKSKIKYPEPQPFVVESIEASTGREKNDRSIRERIKQKEGDVLHLSRLENDLEGIYATGSYERVGYELKPSGHLEVQAREKSLGPNRLRLGFSWDGEIKGKQDGNAVALLKFTQLNALQAEWITEIHLGTSLELKSEFYQPLDYRSWFFISPSIQLARLDQEFYANDRRLAAYEVDLMAGQVDLGLALGRYGEARAGIRQSILNTELALGAPTIREEWVRSGALLGSLKFDQLDSAYFPRSGFRWAGEAIFYENGLGSEFDYRKLMLHALTVLSVKDLSLAFMGQAGFRWNTEIPDFDEFTLGGFQSLAGFRDGELRGQNLLAGRAMAYYRLPFRRNIFWKKMYLLGWADLGNAQEPGASWSWNHLEKAGAGGLGFDTPLGAVYLAYGSAGGDHHQFYISVGRSPVVREWRIY